MRKRVYIRADGNQSIGLGHLVRCIALAHMLKENFTVVFGCVEIPSGLKEELALNQFSLKILANDLDFLNEIDSGDIVVLDGYNFSSEYQQEIKQKNAFLVCIDDLHDKYFCADLIINHAPGINSSSYTSHSCTQYALGLDYVLLRPVFLQKAKEQRLIIQEGVVFVCFGGSDSRNITQKVVDILKLDKRFNRIIVVVGEVYPFLESLKQSILDDERFSIYHAIDSDAMCNLMTKSELAIIPASGVLLEVLAVGCKVISGIYIDNQKFIFEQYKAFGAFQSAEDFSEYYIIQAINHFFDHRNISVKRWIDGKSGTRLLNFFKQLSKEEILSLRCASEEDIVKTFEWATDKAIRAYSFNKNEISFIEHSNWFLNKIKNNLCYYFIASIDHNAIGSIRFDIKDNSALISYLLDPAFHNQGLGVVLLKKGVEILMQHNDFRIKEIIGYVIPENIPSAKAFERLGFEKKIDGENFKFIKKLENENRFN